MICFYWVSRKKKEKQTINGDAQLPTGTSRNHKDTMDGLRETVEGQLLFSVAL